MSLRSGSCYKRYQLENTGTVQEMPLTMAPAAAFLKHHHIFLPLPTEIWSAPGTGYPDGRMQTVCSGVGISSVGRVMGEYFSPCLLR